MHRHQLDFLRGILDMAYQGGISANGQHLCLFRGGSHESYQGGVPVKDGQLYFFRRFADKPYLKVYTYYTKEDAKNDFQSQKDKYDYYEEKKENFQIAYSSQGFMIMEQGIIIKMSNSSLLLEHQLSQKEIQNMIKQIGYTIE